MGEIQRHALSSPAFVPYRERQRLRRIQSAPSNLRILQDSFKSVGKEYCAESSICGLKHIVDEKTSNFERVIWILTMIGALVCSVSLVYVTFRKYYMAPLITTQMPEGVSVKDIIFPAVGICTTNRISKKAVTELAYRLLNEKRNQEYNFTEMIFMLNDLGQLYDYEPMEFEEEFASKTLHKILGDYNVNELLKELTPKCDDILEYCRWQGHDRNCSSLFDFRLTMNGYCCTFNYLRQSDVFEENINTRSIDMYQYGNQSEYGVNQGLKALVKLNTSDDFYYNIPLKGVQLQFSDAYDFPDAPSGSFAAQILSPSIKMKVSVTASLTEATRDIQHIAVDLRGCLFYDESDYLPFYTHSDCMLKCRMLFLLDKCSCSPFNMPKMNNVRTCNLQDMACLRKFYARSIANKPDVPIVPPELELDLVGGGISCPMCYPTCSKTAYSFEFSNVNYYPERLNKIHNSKRENWMKDINFTDTAIVDVQYAMEKAECFGQSVIMQWFDMFSHIGSTCGFVTGFSFVSCLEFIYFMTIKLIREFISRKKKTKPEMSFAPPKTDSLGPTTKFRPIYWNEIAGYTSRHNNMNFD